jgi:hypothetical protein
MTPADPHRDDAHLDREVARHHLHAALGDAVRREAREREVLVHARHVDDGSRLAAVLAVAHEGLGREERALEVHVHHAVVLVLRHVPEVRHDLHPRVVDEHVDRAEVRDGLLDQLLAVRDL